MYQELADMACERITAGITRAFVGQRPIKAVLDPYNHAPTIHVNFTTSKGVAGRRNARRCHINWVIIDSDWEPSSARGGVDPRVASTSRIINLGLESLPLWLRDAQISARLHRSGGRRAR